MTWAIWITGLPGSGKTTLAREVAAALAARGEAVEVLELDEIRRVVTPAPTYSEEERDIVYRALAYFTMRIVRAGVPVLIDATGHRRRVRRLARALIPRFAEVFLACPLERCREREAGRPPGFAPEDIYLKGEERADPVPGLIVPYEPPVHPELTLDAEAQERGEGLAAVLALIDRLAADPADRRGGATQRHGHPPAGRPGDAGGSGGQAAGSPGDPPPRGVTHRRPPMSRLGIGGSLWTIRKRSP